MFLIVINDQYEMQSIVKLHHMFPAGQTHD